MQISVGVSNRHIHLTANDAAVLFGEGYKLTSLRPLKQPGQFACHETVDIQGPKGTIYTVRVLGPYRSYSQVEISRTDSFLLGIAPVVRDSGDIDGTPGIEVIGPAGVLKMDKGVILAHRHLHLHPRDAAKLGVRDKDLVMVKGEGDRSLVFDRVLCRVSDAFVPEFHIDTDEANAALLSTGDTVNVIAVRSTSVLNRGTYYRRSS